MAIKTNEIIDVKTLKPFKRFIMSIGVLPTSYLESMTYAELVMWFCNFLQEQVIPTVNNNAEAVEELQNLYYEIREYVDNELPEVVSDKLDEYVEDGTLERLLNDKLNLITAFDTYSDMIEASSTFVAGMKVKTLGYYTVGDGGESEYYITDTTNDNYQIDLENGLYAELIIKNNTVNVHQLGAKGDNLTDDTLAINTALSLNATNIIFNKLTYKVKGYEDGQATGGTTGLVETTGLIIPSNKIVDLNNATISVITNGRTNYNIFTIKEVDNVILKNGNIVGDRKYHTDTNGQWGYGISIRYATNITLENLKCSECWGDGININNNGNISTLCKNIYINNCICDSNRRQGLSIENGDNIIIKDSQFNNTGNDSYFASPAGGVDIEPLSDQFVKNVKFINCIFDHNYGAGINIVGKKDSSDICHVQNVYFKDCLITRNTGTYATAHTSMLIVEGLKIDNCKWIDNIVTSFALRPFNNFEIINSKLYDTNILLYGGFMNNSIGRFINNYFYNEKTLSYNSLIETVDSPSGQSYGDGKNTLEVINNNLINKVGVNVQQSVKCTVSARFNKLIAKDNVIKYGGYGMRIQCSCILEGNDFIAQYNPAIYIGQGTAYDVSDIRDNIFEETAYQNQYAGVIYNTNYHNNLILQDNTLYKNCLNIGDQVEKTYSCSRFAQNETITGITLNDNNNIFDNAIS